MKILPIASGKGGVGKSLLAANLSLALGEAGKQVILADLDLGASNVHQILGLPRSEAGIGTFLTRGQGSLGECVLDSGYKNLRVLLGDTEIPGMANLQLTQKNRLLRELRKLEADFLVLDLGAGTTFNTIDFFLSSPYGIIITAPSLTSTLNAYLFLKNVVFRLLYSSFKKKSPAYERLDLLRKDGRALQQVYLPKLLEELGQLDPVSYEAFSRKMQGVHPFLVMNMLENPKDVDKGEKIKRSCSEYLALNLEHLGIIYRDSNQDIALRSRLPILRYKPNSVIAQSIHRIAEKIIERDLEEGEGPLDSSRGEESFSPAAAEAETDYSARLTEIQNLLRTGALSPGDIMEIVKTQTYEITSLRQENQLLKVKLSKAVEQGFSV
ncbi:MAG: P-loop NTPase [Spirochaetales bacterium]|jgi:flagellar biosynthesis protein FlhG|nr:P-loop NTPase [Spirochaetales bacterium]